MEKDYKKAYMWAYLSQLSGEDNSKKLEELKEEGWFSSAKVSQKDAEEAETEAKQKYDEIQKNKKK